MHDTIEIRSMYDQARGATQQHDVDLTKFLASGETISSATATHIPKNGECEDEGISGTATVGTIVGGIIPVSLTIPVGNPLGIHILEIKPICVSPVELPIFRVLIRVPF